MNTDKSGTRGRGGRSRGPGEACIPIQWIVSRVPTSKDVATYSVVHHDSYQSTSSTRKKYSGYLPKMALKGVKVVEIMGLAPGPLCGTILADYGATVTVVSRVQPSPFNVMSNGKRMLAVDLKTKEGLTVMKKLCAVSDVLLDTFRPGVMENLGLGPDQLLKQNNRLIYARLSGYGQDGPYKFKAGHDINYVAMSGVLSLLSKDKKPPTPPVNLLADFAGGSLMCTFGILLALFERNQSGKGQVIDNSMTGGLAYLSTWLFKSRDLPIWGGEPGTNALDGGLPCYGTYKTKDGKFMAIGALEPQFYSNLLNALQLSEDEYPQFDVEKCKKKFEEIFASKTQEEWCNIFDEVDACVTPVLDFDALDQHKFYSGSNLLYRNDEGTLIPETAPKLSRTPGQSVSRHPASLHGQHTLEILKELGYDDKTIKNMIQNGCVYALEKSHL